MNVASKITDLVGNTPMLNLMRVCEHYSLNANIIAKLEYLNPCGSVKDRTALNMINQAEVDGLLNADSVVIEPTSGNTGIGLAMACIVKGYKLILTMPENMSQERVCMLKAMGADVVLTETKLGMQGSVDKANELAGEYKNSFIPQQFKNPNNPKTHIKSTAVEIFNDTDGKIDIFVAGVGTGGTITGVSTYLKEKNPNIISVAVEPSSSPVLSKGISGPHKIQGIGAGFVPDIYDSNIVDEIITVDNDDAINTSRLLTRLEGIMVGISSGAAVYAAIKLAKRTQNKNIVVVLPDGGLKYISSGLYDIE